MNRHCFIALVIVFGTVTIGSPVSAQTTSDAAVPAQQRYEREVASCNNGAMAAPDREACIRIAGTRLDRVRGTPAVDAPLTTPDGRATVVAPEGATMPSGSSNADTSRDGRATVVR
ncbi:MAG TPA: hypothetical protein VLJ57_20320 [Burkholderiaceae bacterium]|nr:hypothetical protein [Burkholderiaceae bacterium]